MIWKACSYVRTSPTMHPCFRLVACVWSRHNHTTLRPSDAYICVSKLTNIDADNGLSPGRHQVIIWANVGILLIRTFWTNFSEILCEIHTFHSRKCIWKCRLWNGGNQFCPGLHVLAKSINDMSYCYTSNTKKNVICWGAVLFLIEAWVLLKQNFT